MEVLQESIGGTPLTIRFEEPYKREEDSALFVQVPDRTRAQVYHCINTEREYGNRLWNNNTKSKTDPSSWILYLHDYIDQVKHIASTKTEKHGTEGRKEIMGGIRKIASLAVACMEACGCSQRDVENDLKEACIINRLD